jgi:hypothetical protein
VAYVRRLRRPRGAPADVSRAKVPLQGRPTITTVPHCAALCRTNVPAPRMPSQGFIRRMERDVGGLSARVCTHTDRLCTPT